MKRKSTNTKSNPEANQKKASSDYSQARKSTSYRNSVKRASRTLPEMINTIQQKIETTRQRNLPNWKDK
jgi:hypothetical protein